MMRIFRQWLVALNEVERDLWNQGYIVIYGGGTSFVLPVVSSDRPPQQPGKRSLLWHTAPEAFRRPPSCRPV
jgi:hypothetical protein